MKNKFLFLLVVLLKTHITLGQEMLVSVLDNSKNMVHSISDEAIEIHDIRISEYVFMLNAIASQSDEYNLYDRKQLGKEIVVQENPFSLRVQSQVLYVAANGVDPDSSLVGLTEMQAMRYCNWVEQGSKTSLPEALSTTETGSYDLIGAEIVVNQRAQHHVAADVENSGYFIITTYLSNGEKAIPFEQETSPLMMFFGGEHNEKKGIVDQDPNKSHVPVDSHHEHEDNLGNRSSLVGRGSISQGVQEKETENITAKKPAPVGSDLSMSLVTEAAQTKKVPIYKGKAKIVPYPNGINATPTGQPSLVPNATIWRMAQKEKEHSVVQAEPNARKALIQNNESAIRQEEARRLTPISNPMDPGMALYIALRNVFK